ncbi:dTDP-4-amino-4,6-dideoxygalactose transaminase [uncultured archaeon]|nr:dTDP-4-amino-4,6-dideoxygalactose transaminase [uncultured archaeon]
MIPFNIPLITGKESDYLSKVLQNGKFCGDGNFSKKCDEWLKNNARAKKALLTTSCKHALEMSAFLCDIDKGDEVIMPSFTFVSTANAFLLRGAKIIFVDIRPDTMNIDVTKIEDAITNRTKASVPVHYAGVGCEMDAIMDLARKYNLFVVEDAAQGLIADYKGRALGSIGHAGCYSFHETKNYQCGEGGAILVNDEGFIERAEIIREKGTDRNKFLRGEVDKYTWVDVGSSYLPAELNAAFLYAQLEKAEEVTIRRLDIWHRYFRNLKELETEGYLELTKIPAHCKHNAHIFYIKLKDLDERQKMIDYLKGNGIQTVFHYVPLHSSRMGKLFCEFRGEDVYTTKDSERLLRLPLFFSLSFTDVDFVSNKIRGFFGCQG